MCDKQYHEEARRKARIVKKQQEYLESLAAKAAKDTQNMQLNIEENLTGAPESMAAVQLRPETDPTNAQNIRLDSGFRSCQHNRGLWGMDMNKPPKDAWHRFSTQMANGIRPNLHPHWPMWDKELRQHAKTLRNNFMYMGQTRSFAHLYEAPRGAQDNEAAGLPAMPEEAPKPSIFPQD